MKLALSPVRAKGLAHKDSSSSYTPPAMPASAPGATLHWELGDAGGSRGLQSGPGASTGKAEPCQGQMSSDSKKGSAASWVFWRSCSLACHYGLAGVSRRAELLSLGPLPMSGQVMRALPSVFVIPLPFALPSNDRVWPLIWREAKYILVFSAENLWIHSDAVAYSSFY